MQESGQVGEIQSAQRELLVRELLGHGRRFGPLHAADEAITDLFAITDNTSRFATVYAWSDWLKKYYKAKGETRTEEQLLREAAEITKRRSVTFSRVPTALKAVERSGLTMFLPYFAETFRVTAFSAYDSIKMVKDGIAEGGKAGAMKVDQGLRGFAGTMGSIALFKMAMGAMVKAGAAGLAILGLASDEPPEAEEEDLKRIQEAMGERYDGKTLHLLEVTPGGRYVFLEGERMAMLDPSFGSILKLAQGDVDGAAKDLSNLLFSNTLYKRFWEMATEDKAREPTVAQQFPQSYAELQNLVLDLDVPMYPLLGPLSPTVKVSARPETTDRVSRIAELGIPTTAMTGSAAFAGEQDFSPETNLLAGTGAKLAIYDPKRSLKTDVRREYGNVVNEQRDAFKDVYSATNPSDATLRKRYQEGLVKEFEAFEKLQKLVDGARAAGLKDPEIRSMLTADDGASLTKVQAAAALRGEFRPTLVSEKVLAGTKENDLEKVKKTLKAAKTPEEKKRALEERDRITDKYKRLRTIVLELNKANNIKPIEE
jgi:hypothetical protein